MGGTRSAWEDCADDYAREVAESPWGQALYSEVASRVKRLLKGRGPGATILDVAAAVGEPALTVAACLPAAKIIATDASQAMVQAMRSRVRAWGLPNVVCKIADGEMLVGFKDGTVDVVTCAHGVEYMPSAERAVAEFWRVARRGGWVVVVTWAPPRGCSMFAFQEKAHHLQEAAEAAAEGWPPPRGGEVPGRAPDHLGREGVLMGLLEGAGFVEVQEQRGSVTHRLGKPPAAVFRDEFEVPFATKIARCERSQNGTIKK
mmetsp:Transcript_39827/g.127349  ORF Transcript_39827/g.127349 Transcript_39827/m.127349 type:complete len:260 (+) Transcript_39827:402-1181(+)